MTYLVTGAIKDWSTVTVHQTSMQDWYHWEAPGMKEKSNTVGKKSPNFTVISLPTFLWTWKKKCCSQWGDVAGLEDNFLLQQLSRKHEWMHERRKLIIRRNQQVLANPQSVPTQSSLTFQKISWESTAEMFTGPLLETHRINWHLLTVILRSVRKNGRNFPKWRELLELQ